MLPQKKVVSLPMRDGNIRDRRNLGFGNALLAYL